jgi:hypothetical protein
VDTWKDLEVNRLYVLEEGGRLLKSDGFSSSRKKS